jgi:hypothetical protein
MLGNDLNSLKKPSKRVDIFGDEGLQLENEPVFREYVQ